MEKDNVGGRRGPDKDGLTKQRGERRRKPRYQFSASSFLKFPPLRHADVRSPRRREIAEAADEIRLFAAGGNYPELSETDLNEHLALPKGRTLALSGMRLLATRYPECARLVLRRGSWLLVPAEAT